MKEKIVIGCISLVFILVAISFATAVNSNTIVDKKETPLFKIRTNRAIKEKLIENIKTKYIGDRLFFLPALSEKTSSVRDMIVFKTQGYTYCDFSFCYCTIKNIIPCSS
jgi:hypothetical protein